MPSAVTVIAHVETSDQALVGLVESIDAQSLPYADFDVVFVVPEAAREVNERLGQLAGRRPNVDVRSFAGGWPEAVFDAALSAGGEWVLPLGPGLQGPKATLLPQTLERLVAYGREHDCDVVASRVSAATAALPIPHALGADAPRIPADQFEEALGSPARIYRTAFVRNHNLLPSAADAARLTELTDKVGVFGGYPALRDVTVDVGAAGQVSVPVSLKGASWHSGAVALDVALVGAPDLSVTLSVRQLQTAEEYWLETHHEGGSGVYSANLDVRTAALGAALGEGQWQVYVNAYRAGGDPFARTPLPTTSLPSAVVDGIFIAPTAPGGLLTLDVGGTATSPLPTLSVDQVSITEDADGTLLTAHLPSMHVVGACEHDAALRLGAFRLPGKFVSDGQTAQLECYVSGLAGTSVLSHQIGFGPVKRTSLDLIIDEVGGIRVAPTSPSADPAAAPASTPPARPAAKKPAAKTAGKKPGKKVAGKKPGRKAAAKKPGAQKPAAKRSAVSKKSPPEKSPANPRAERALMTRIRRNVPGLLEPAVKRVAQQEQARKIYRKLTGRR